MHIVIRAGGSGMRLWPLSRQDQPKQFHALLSEESLIRATFNRIKEVVKDLDNVYVSVNSSHIDQLLKELPELSRTNIVFEPVTRDTGPAMCLEVCFLSKRLPAETIVASLPSDDYIGDEEAFGSMLQACENFIGKHPEYIITPAAHADYAETGYSYLEAGEKLEEAGKNEIYQVHNMVEKPSLEKATALLESGKYFWHTGMYVWQLGRIMQLFQELQPAMVEICERIVDLELEGNQTETIRELYLSLEKISVEAAITRQVTTLALSVTEGMGWSDIGKWRSIKRILGNELSDNVLDDNVIAHISEDNLVVSRLGKKLIVLNHVKNLAIIETEDVLLISDLDATEDIKKIIESLDEKYTHHV